MFIKSLFVGLMMASISAGVLSGAGEVWPDSFSSPHQYPPASEIIFPSF